MNFNSTKTKDKAPGSQTMNIVDNFSQKYKDIPVFVAGDFKVGPENYQIANIMNLAFLDLYSITKYQEGDITQPNQHPAFTTMKYKMKEGWVKKTTDYIFMAKNQYLKNRGVIIQEYLDPSDLAS